MGTSPCSQLVIPPCPTQQNHAGPRGTAKRSWAWERGMRRVVPIGWISILTRGCAVKKSIICYNVILNNTTDKILH